MANYWDCFFKKNKIDKIIIDNLLICPYLFSLITVSKFYKKRIILINKKDRKDQEGIITLNKNISVFKLFFSNIISFYALKDKNMEIYRYVSGKIKKVNIIFVSLLMLKNTYFKIKIIKNIHIARKKKYNLKDVYFINKFDYLNLIYFNEEFINYTQYFEQQNDLNVNKFKYIMIDHQLIFNFDISEILNKRNLKFFMLNKKISSISKFKI